MLVVVAVACDEHHHDKESEGEGDADIELHLHVVDEILYVAVDYAAVEKNEIDTGEEAEQSADILHCR